jgi:serine/threonine protein kinase
LAPEVINLAYNEKCDIWALGVITYQLFSQGKFPFEGENEVRLYKKILKGQPYFPESRKNGDVEKSVLTLKDET